MKSLVPRFTDLSIKQPGVGYTLRTAASSFTILVP